MLSSSQRGRDVPFGWAQTFWLETNHSFLVSGIISETGDVSGIIWDPVSVSGNAVSGMIRDVSVRKLFLNGLSRVLSGISILSRVMLSRVSPRREETMKQTEHSSGQVLNLFLSPRSYWNRMEEAFEPREQSLAGSSDEDDSSLERFPARRGSRSPRARGRGRARGFSRGRGAPPAQTFELQQWD